MFQRASLVAALFCAVALPATSFAQAQPSLYEQAKTWRNPKPMHETWRNGVDLKSEGGLWDFALVDGAGIALPPPYHAGDVTVEGSKGNPYASLLVSHDPSFDSEREDDWEWGKAAVSRYNNAFLIGMSGWMPRPATCRHPATEIAVRFKARWPQGYQSLGTSGVWLEQAGTFDENGLMLIPFQAAGLSYTSAASALFPGLGIEGVTAFVPDNYAPVPPVDISQWHTYLLTLRWKDESTMVLGLTVDNGPKTEIDVVPFGPFEVQIWRDNYLVVPDPETWFRISYMNFPEGWVDPFQVGKIKIWERPVHEPDDD